MSIFSRIAGKVTGATRREELRTLRAFKEKAEQGEFRRRKRKEAYKKFLASMGGSDSVDAARKSNPRNWDGTPSKHDEDAANKEYLYALADVLQRSQNLDVNNPDLRGFHRTRTAQILGAHVKLKSTPAPDEVGLTAKALLVITTKIDRIRHLHSFAGGFDATGKNFTEGMQQVRALLTTLIHGCCLVHKVWRMDNELLPLSLELIPGVRISTPIDRTGDPKISYGIEYADTHRSRVVAYHVRRVSKTMGDSFVPDFTWDRLPAEDCELMELPEPAGMDRAMPLSVATVRMARNRGEMMEAMVSSARAQANIYASIEMEEGTAAGDAVLDDADEEAESFALRFQKIGEVMALYNPKGRRVNWNTARLPDPDLKGFMDVTDSRLSRGLTSAKSRFTREVTSSWAAGRMEDQQDDPIIDQYRSMVLKTWARVHRWFLEACWLTDLVALPGFSAETELFWSQFRAEFPAKVDINRNDTAAATEKGYMLRTVTPQKAVESGGGDLRENLELWADALVMAKEIEESRKLPPGSIAFLISGKTISTAAGDEVAAPTPAIEPQPGEGDAGDGGAGKPKLKIAGGA